jgi:hypothetical protein
VALAAAHRNMEVAAARLRECEIRGIIPEDLKKSGDR